MKNLNKYLKYSFLTLLIIGFSGCQKLLDLKPTNEQTSEKIYSTADGYTQVMAKVYGAMALTGNAGPAGSADVSGDEGFSDFIRGFWNLQSLPTEEAVWSWNDAGGIADINTMTWSASNGLSQQLYRRSYFQIVLCNDFIEQSSDANLSLRGISGADAERIKDYRNEARFLRAFQYWVLMDIFGNVPFVTKISRDLPVQKTRSEIFNFVESELKELEEVMLAPKSNQYGRVDRAAAWAVLARMYLNAEVYTGTPKFSEAITYSRKIIDAGYTLHSDYRSLFMADNHTIKDEFIFAVPYDGQKSQGFGGTTYLIKAGTFDDDASKMMPNGLNEGWECIRVRANLPELFPNQGLATPAEPKKDLRAWFANSSTLINITQVLNSKGGGFRCNKFTNLASNPSTPPNNTQQFSDADFPLFRLAEFYLIYAESVLRGGSGGDAGTALSYINQLRKRAYTDATGNSTTPDNGQISAADLTLDFMLDERGRELYWEGHRRTDLIRFGRFTSGNYLWQFKGGSATGKAVPSYYNLYPIPASDLLVNTNLKQNPGY
jgi:hypothetical protein